MFARPGLRRGGRLPDMLQRKPNARLVQFLLAVFVTPVLLAACAKDDVTKPRAYTLTGQVRLVGTVKNDAGDSTDVQLVENADSVLVYLYQGATRRDSTRTASGRYHFSGLSGGPYSVATVLWGDIGDTVSIASMTADMAADTLVLESTPTLIGFPNPFQNATSIQFPVYSNSFVELVARRPSGLTVRSFIQQTLPAGYHAYNWDATDDLGNAIPPGPLWILYKAGTDYRCRLLVKL